MARYDQKWNSFTEDLWEPFLDSLEKTGAYIRACDSINVNYQLVCNFRKENPDFQELCNVALERYRQKFLIEAERRAVEGYERPIIGGRNRDQVVAKEVVYSDRLLELFLKRSANGSFTDKQEIVHSGEFNLRAEMDLGRLSKEARRKLRDLCEQINIDNANRALGKEVE